MELLCFLSVVAVVNRCWFDVFLCHCIYFWVRVLFTYRTLRSGVSRYLNLLTGRKSAFSLHRGDSLHRIMWNFAQLKDTRVRLALQNFTPIGARGWNAAPKWQKFPPFGKDSPHTGEPSERFLPLLGAFSLLYAKLSFIGVSQLTRLASQIREFFAEKPHVGHLPRNFPV